MNTYLKHQMTQMCNIFYYYLIIIIEKHTETCSKNVLPSVRKDLLEVIE